MSAKDATQSKEMRFAKKQGNKTQIHFHQFVFFSILEMARIHVNITPHFIFSSTKYYIYGIKLH